MGKNRGSYKYLNTGGLMGFAGALLPLLNRTVMPINHTVRAARTGACCRWTANHTVLLGCWCHHLGADQIAFSRVLTDHWSDFNVSLDYDSAIFYVASGPDWVASEARIRMQKSEPCVVHVPGVSERYRAREPKAVDTRNATMQSLFSEFALAHETTVCELQLSAGGCASSPGMRPGVWFAPNRAGDAAIATDSAKACQLRLRTWTHSCGSGARLQMRLRSTLHGVKWRTDLVSR